MPLFGKYRGKHAAGLATVAALLQVFLLGGCGAPTPKCYETEYRIYMGIVTLGSTEALIDDSYCPAKYHEIYLEQAQKGDPQAQYLVSFSIPDPDEKWMWLCRSVMQGHPYAQKEIAIWYDSNIPERSWRRLPLQRPDNVNALVWYTLAISNGLQNGEHLRNRVAASLTPDQVAEAERLVAEWKPDQAWCDRATSPDS